MVEAKSDFPAIAALIIFILAVVAVLVTVLLRVPIPFTEKLGAQPNSWVPHGGLRVPYWLAPPLGCVAMLACTSMSWADVGRGIVGDENIKPYGIMILFMSLAYVGASVDSSGIFAYLALKITYLAKGHGRALFMFYFLLSSFITTFTSNDVCIVTLTPIIVYFARAANLDPLPWLMAEYAAGNIFGALIYIGNPTNIIVAQANKMSFGGYSKIMTLPTMGAGATGLLVLWLMSKGQVPERVTLPTLPPRLLLRDPLGALFHSATALSCLALLAAAPTLGWEMWAITLVCATVCAAYNAWTLLLQPLLGGRAAQGAPGSDVVLAGAEQGDQAPQKAEAAGEAGLLLNEDKGHADAWGQGVELAVRSSSKEAPGLVAVDLGGPRVGNLDGHGSKQGDGSQSQARKPVRSWTEGSSLALLGQERAGQEAGGSQGPGQGAESAIGDQQALEAGEGGQGATTESVKAMMGVKHPTFIGLILGMPWEVLPFALGMFVLVEGLSVQGWVDVAADGLGRASNSLPAAIFIMGWLTILLCNTANNQPATILLTRICLSPYYKSHLGEGSRRYQAALFALVMGSNLGAIYTLIGALAGIMWSNIMHEKGIKMSYAAFLKKAPPIGFSCMVVSLFIIWFEYAVFPSV